MPGGRPEKYPWSDWFAGLDHGPLDLRRAVDFPGTTRDFAKQITAKARLRGVAVHTTQLQGGVLRVTRAKARMPWDVLLDGELHALKPGTDFPQPPEAMAKLARDAARRRGMRVRTVQWQGRLWVQALPADSNALESVGSAG